MGSQELIDRLSPRGYTWKVSRLPMKDHAAEGTGPFGEDIDDFNTGRMWRTGDAASKDANAQCWNPGAKYDASGKTGWYGVVLTPGALKEQYECNVHGKHDRASCLD